MTKEIETLRPEDMLLTFSHTAQNLELGGYTTTWIMRLTGEGRLQFNRDAYPNLTPDEFAEKVVTVLEDNFRFNRI